MEIVQRRLWSVIGLLTGILLPEMTVLSQSSLQFDGTNDYVTFGQATSTLGAQTFTLEVWFKRTGAGAAGTTGSGGITSAIPILTKGRNESDGSNVDMNYWLGIDNATGRLAADFEDFATGLNHPIIGVTTLSNNVWYHAAATYDGTTWVLYLNGTVEATLVIGSFTPRYDGIQHAALGSALNSSGTAAGFFAGLLDEARIWSVVRTQPEIQSSMYSAITSGAGLLGRWGLDEGTGTSAGNSVAGGPNGTLTNGPVWSMDQPIVHEAMAFGSGTGYATFGDNAALQLAQFTIETWFKRIGTGTTTSTGTGGITAIPLVTKGRGEAEGSNVDMNYFLGINSGDNVLAADFEEGPGGPGPLGQNHPVFGVTPIVSNTWYHAAATFDGTSWRLYLNGNLEATLNTAGATPRSDCIQHAGLATAMTSTGAAGGHFDGILDEVRIWNVARSQSEIFSSINSELTGPQTGLVGRWPLSETSGTVVQSTAGTSIDGTLMSSGWYRTGAAPFNIPLPGPPAAPGNLLATASSPFQVDLTWDDNSDNESGFEIDRSTAGSGGPYSLLTTVGANISAFSDMTVNPSSDYCYRVRAVNPTDNSAYTDPSCASTPAEVEHGLDLGSGGAYVTFGQAMGLATQTFTVEIWFKRTGAGTANTTGSGGITIVPLLAKGSPEAENSTVDANYILGIQSGTNVIAADFEEGTGSTSPGLNHPLVGVTPIANDVWHHAAATFSGGIYSVYLDGVLENTTDLGSSRWPQGASIQHAALGTMISSTGAAVGRFQGVLDEARIWNYGRTLGEIQSTIDSRISAPQTGLIGRWSMNEGTGNTVNGGAGTNFTGTITGSGSSWTTPGAPFDIVFAPPDPPTNLVITPISNTVLQVGWSDNSSNETGFEIEISTNGGTFSPLATVGPNVITYNSINLAPVTEYCYRVRAVRDAMQSAFTSPDCGTTLADPNFAIDFNGSSGYVSFGNPASLKLTEFTVEAWFRRDGAGGTTETGTSGIAAAVPLVAKGTADVEVPAQDGNYILAINTADNTICADFEEYPSGLNHPVLGVTPIVNGVWYHAAAAYDGNKWQLFLNGILERELIVGAQPGNLSDCPVAIATSMRLDNSLHGFFDGVIDEVRIWDHARTAGEITASINEQITTAQPGLIARWGLNEGSGSAVNGTAGTVVNGVASGTYAWVPGAPFNISYSIPNPPSNLIVTTISNSVLQLNWTDNSLNETGFEIERSTTGPGGPFSYLATVTANIVAYNSIGLDPLTDYCYRVRAISGPLTSDYTSPGCGTTSDVENTAIDLGSSGAYVTFGLASNLAAQEFTVEVWFKRTGTGTANTTGTGGINIIPLLTKGSPEQEGSTVDENYVLGIQSGTNVIAADFEEGTGSTSPGQNHPLIGVTEVTDNVWHHAAATFSGGVFTIYLDGVLEGTSDLGPSVWPQGSSVQHSALGTMINSSGTPVGAFQGVLDEARVWNYGRTLTEIRSTINSQISSPQTGLLARWGLNEGAGTSVASSVGVVTAGTITGSGYAWVPGAPFNLLNLPPDAPVLFSPADGATGVATSPTLDVTVSDPDGGNLTVEFYGRPKNVTAPAFTIVVLPDAQNYTSSAGGGLPATFTAQTQWCVTNRVARNILYVSMLGDITNDNTTTAWVNANTAMSLLDTPPPGIPYGIILGNHDYVSPPTKYGDYFPVSRFTGRPYYGGSYDANNENHYEFFSADGLEFIVINISAGDQNPPVAVLDWADILLKTYATKRGIVVNHSLLNTGNPASFTGPGQVVYDALKDNPNLFLMMGGHVPGEGRRQDTFNGNTVYSMLADYQNEPNGGNGWLRILEFDPPDNMIHVTTYSPTLDQFKTASSSQYDLPYAMAGNAFQLIGTASGISSGSHATISWPGLSASADYEWFATANDGSSTTTSAPWSFITGAAGPIHTITASAGPNGSISPSGAVPVSDGGNQSFSITPDPGFTTTSILVDGAPVGIVSPYEFTNVTGDRTIAVAFSPIGGSAEEVSVSTTGAAYPFPGSGVSMMFGVLPPGGGTITVHRYAGVPSPPYPAAPAGSFMPVWFDITSTLPNGSFMGDITVDVAGVGGFGADTKVVYYNATSGRWIFVDGAYNAGDQTMTFATNHWTPFAFVDGLTDVHDLCFGASPTAVEAGVIYPNASWSGGYAGKTNDWAFTGAQSFPIYIVPGNGMQLGACELVVQWDESVVQLDDVSFAGSIFSGPDLLFANWNRLGSANSVTINASLISPSNVTTQSGNYLVRLDFTLLKPGHSSITSISDRLLTLNQGAPPTSLSVVPHQAEVKAYLCDVARPGSDETSGDGKTDFQDLVAWSTSYWSGVPPVDMTNYKAKFDIGPTQDGYVFSLPQYDNKIDFEDLIMFSVAYGQTMRHELPKSSPSEKPLDAFLGVSSNAGGEVRVPIMLSGGVQDVRALHLEVQGVFGAYLGVEKGALLRSYQTPVVIMDRMDGDRISIDIAVIGLDANGINASGEVAILRFAGETGVRLAATECRNSANKPIVAQAHSNLAGTIPVEYALRQNYPNPFNPTTLIRYELPQSGPVTLEVFNLLGARVAMLVDAVEEAGVHEVEWRGVDEFNQPVASGMYMCRIKAGTFAAVRKMILLR